MNLDTLATEPTVVARPTPSSTPNIEKKETDGLEKQDILPWTLERLSRTWFLCEEEVLCLEEKASDGANDDQWRQLMASVHVRPKAGQEHREWGPVDRMNWLNWLETMYPGRMVETFTSKEVAFDEVKRRSKKISTDEGASKSFEDVETKKQIQGSDLVIPVGITKVETKKEDTSEQNTRKEGIQDE
jgi:hypothetical protein